MLVHIYGLRDPRDGAIRYVGKTSQSLAFRLQQHVWTASTGRRTHIVAGWICELIAWGLKPSIVLLENVPQERWREAERTWGTRLNAKTRLTNHVDRFGNGPEHSHTARWTPELEARLGRDTDEAIARDMGITRKAVFYRRGVLGIPANPANLHVSKPPPMGGHNRIALPDTITAKFGTMSDEALAREAGVSKPCIGRQRQALGIASYAALTGNTGQFRSGTSTRLGWRKNKDGWYRIADDEHG